MRGATVASSSSRPPSSSRSAKPPSSSKTIGVKRQRAFTISDDERPARRAAPGKGKAKADPIDLDVEEEEEEEEEENMTVHHSQTNGREIDEHDVRLLKRRLKLAQEQLEDALSARDKYHGQLKELHEQRQTVPEEEAQKINELWEARNEVQEQIIANLREQIVEDNSGVNDASRKLAASLEEENAQLKTELSKARDLGEQVTTNQERIKGLEQQNAILKRELQQEKAFGSATRLNGKHTSSTSKVEYPTAFAKVIKLYEDLTNISVLGHKAEPSEFGGDPDDIYSCFVNVGQRSVGFTLKFTKELPEDPNMTAIPSPLVQYTPNTLAQETDDALLNSLEFLREPFHFTPHQLHVFLRSLVDRVNLEGAVDDDGTGEED